MLFSHYPNNLQSNTKAKFLIHPKFYDFLREKNPSKCLAKSLNPQQEREVRMLGRPYPPANIGKFTFTICLILKQIIDCLFLILRLIGCSNYFTSPGRCLSTLSLTTSPPASLSWSVGSGEAESLSCLMVSSY